MAATRLAQSKKLDAWLESWTSVRPAAEVMERLQAVGVPAGKMLRVFEMPDFGFYRERGTYAEAGHPLLPGPFMMENSLARSEMITDPDFAPAPVPGEHSAWVATELLGQDSGTIETHIAEGVIEAANAAT